MQDITARTQYMAKMSTSGGVSSDTALGAGTAKGWGFSAAVAENRRLGMSAGRFLGGAFVSFRWYS